DVEAILGGEVGELWALWEDGGVQVGVEKEADGGRAEAGGEEVLAGLDHRLEGLGGPGGGVAPVDGEGDVDASRGHVCKLALVPGDAVPVQRGEGRRVLGEGGIVEAGLVVPVVVVGHDQAVVPSEAGAFEGALIGGAGGGG